MAIFNGFSQAGLNFLQDAWINNSKTWFDEHRSIYDNDLVKPFKLLVEQLTPEMLKIDEWFETKPAIGKTISRIHRDTRFSKDKTLYRSRLWLTFKRPNKDWKEAPAYFFEISPDSYQYGLGYYCASKQTMDIFREEIANDTAKFLEMIRCVKKPFELVGESYKRPLVKDQDEKIATWYNRKSLAVMVTNNHIADVLDSDLPNKLIKGFKKIVPLYDYLMRVEMIKNIPKL
ncbi:MULTISPECIES: DUF2461 domain-containing protein [unclassified Gilliamella]|uniref:DUF2461 domain-containing protein n=1 Tax=unclassified Gilliamella TaxID=2685620 RepID=UPI002269C7AC|nr:MULTISPECIES: DUF2461 domain-containing protein [unclassified Gilliamella]MCX8641895.1 DUF2461 domain-containing protein [Gilliamella sp. B3835]MCX8706695.1 DUF2461 domain-containing protein [Gilliamella sp. B3783]MCX8708836.1 DUF2461 domain-containing protein [Gilliamella sp. B3780]MCX8713176.1 DUF2461 domain-containing protein [Gilliamella sp. B3468]MCX8713620.1 DUF2461 domain-containing protein [Gilliamella sp. B3781]